MNNDNEISNPRQHLIIVGYSRRTNGNMWNLP